MSPVRDEPASRLRSQATLVFGGGLATGLQLGLLMAYLGQDLRAIFVFTVGSAVFSVTTLLLWQVVFPRVRRGVGWRGRVVQALVATAAMGVTSFLVINAEMLISHGRTMFTPYTGGDKIFVFPANVVAMSPFIYFALPILPAALMAVVGFNQSWWQIFLLEEREHRARELAASAQLDALRAQINPHFLFNSLNSIAQLISSDPERAEACVERLAEIFRYLLRSENRAFVTLGDELEIADAYLDIERARFGERLEVSFDVADSARGRFVPTLILQPLIENAVRHGVSQKVEGGRVSIEASLDGKDLCVVIRDTGVGISGGAEKALSSGIGLRNVHDRLVQLYGKGYAPRIDTLPGAGTSVTVRVPLGAASAVIGEMVH